MGCNNSKEREKKVDVPTTKPAADAQVDKAKKEAEDKAKAAAQNAKKDADNAADEAARAASNEAKARRGETGKKPNEVNIENANEEDNKNTQAKLADAARFSNGAPTVQGKYQAIFNEGLLFQIVHQKDGQNAWSFYNDTTTWEMRITYIFGPRSKIQAVGNTVMETQEDGWFKCTLSVNPGETEGFIVGTPNGYRCNFQSAPVSEEYKANLRKACDKKIHDEMNAVKALGINDVNELVDECIRSKKMFVDVSFPPFAESLCRPFDMDQVTTTTWRRPRDFLPEGTKINLIVGKIEANDIDQGQLGDCWYLCAIAAVAEYPEKIIQLLGDYKNNADEREVGAYRVQMNKNGWWHTVILDSYLPVNANGPCFAKNVQERGELWVSMLEKAYAKLHGSYAAIVGGDALEALQDLTGAPSLRLEKEWVACGEAPNSKESREFFARLCSYDKQGFMITVSTPGTDDSDYMGSSGANNSADFAKRYKDAGLGMGHAYTVVAAKEFAEEGFRLLKIRNPWGNGTEWTGDWSDTCDLWKKYPHIAKACGAEVADDGTFWITFEDALKYFDGIGICFLHFGWHDYRIQGRFVDGIPNTILSIKVTEPTTVYCMLGNPDTRGAHPDSEEAQRRATLLHLAEHTGEGQTYRLLANSTRNAECPGTKWTFSNARDLAMKVTLEPREEPYLLIPNAYKKPDTQKPYVLGLLADKPVASVKFLKPDSQMELFLNYPQFNLNAAECNATYQVRVDGAGAVTRQGTSVQ